jgi:DNA modification methylase
VNIERLPISELHPDPANVRQHPDRNLEAIKASLARFGQQKPIVIDANNVVRAGNGTLAAAKALGWTEIDAVRTGLNGSEATAFAISDNRTAELAEWDESALYAQLASLQDEGFDLPELGFDTAEVADLLDAPAGSGDTDAIPDEPEKPWVQSGDLFLLGEHRLLCGSSTDAADVDRLMDGKRARCMWTDPPYGVSYVGKTKNALTIENDGAEGLEALINAAFAQADRVLEPGGAIYVAHPAGALNVTFGVSFLAAGWRLHETLIWVKDSFALGHSDYHFRHEPIFYGYKPGEGRWGRGGQGWYGDDAQDSIFEVPKPRRNDKHPTSKPVDLIVRMLKNSTQPGDRVYEPFAGSGSTLIACQTLGRKCCALEIDPRYAQVVIERWEAFTGQKAQKAG